MYICSNKHDVIYVYILKHTYTVYLYTCTHIHIDYVLTECEVCTKKSEGKYFPVQTEQTKLIRNLLYGFWFLSLSLLMNVLVRELVA